jgi:hypothetical protein
MANGVTRIINAEMAAGKIAKGKALKGQLASEFSPKRVSATRPEQYKKKKASK